MPPVAVLLAVLGPAHAAEVQFEGFYRARGRGFDSLSLAGANLDPAVAPSVAEGGAIYAQHRLWLRPRFVLSDKVALFTEFRGLDNVVWGRDPVLYDQYVPAIFDIYEYGLTAPRVVNGDLAPGSAGEVGAAGLLDISLWRAWGEVSTSIGRFTVGRVPLHWGLGIWLNDGVSIDPTFSDHGDTTDRVMWEYLVQDQIYVRAAVDIPTSGLIGVQDDTTSINGAVAYRTEDITAGILLQVDHAGPNRGDSLKSFNLFTVDAAADVRLGKLHAGVEGVGHFGSGALGTFDSANVFALGAAAQVDLETDPWNFQVRGGFASGDQIYNDGNLRTYTFDRDYSVGMFLFEQPLPTLADEAGRDFDDVRSGVAISNAMFVRPSVSRQLVEGLVARATYVTARTAAGHLVNEVTPRNAGYGHEFQLGLTYDGIDHLDLDARAGVFVPGAYYSSPQNISTGATGEGVPTFDAPAFGAQLTGRIHF